MVLLHLRLLPSNELYQMLHITKMVAFYLQAWKKLNIKKKDIKNKLTLKKQQIIFVKYKKIVNLSFTY